MMFLIGYAHFAVRVSTTELNSFVEVLDPASSSISPLRSSISTSSPQWNEGASEPVKMAGIGFGERRERQAVSGRLRFLPEGGISGREVTGRRERDGTKSSEGFIRISQSVEKDQDVDCWTTGWRDDVERDRGGEVGGGGEAGRLHHALDSQQINLNETLSCSPFLSGTLSES